MVVSSVSTGDGAELERLYTDYLHTVEQAREVLRSHGMNSSSFRRKDAEIGVLRSRIEDILGTGTEWEEWE